MIIKKEPNVKRVLVNWAQLIIRRENYYLAKAIDLFWSMPCSHQKGLLSFVVSQIPNKRWEAMIEDETQHLDAIRSILMYYTGQEEYNEPHQKLFIKMIAGYLKSDFFVEAEETAGDTTNEAPFNELLLEL